MAQIADDTAGLISAPGFQKADACGTSSSLETDQR